MEGLFNPQSFRFKSGFNHEAALLSVVKVRPKRLLSYKQFDSEEDAKSWSKFEVDSTGLETIYYGFTEKMKERCQELEFSQALFTHEFCELVGKNASFPAQTSIKGHGNGVLISADGFIATNHHLVSGAIEFHKKESGLKAAELYPAPQIEVEIAEHIESDGIISYRKIDKVFLAACYSVEDAYGKKLDLAILKVEQATPHFSSIAAKPCCQSDRIYSIGFSMRTARPEQRKNLIGYQDANYDLRVSTGLVVNLEAEQSFLSDADGAPGSSGTPAFNEAGELVGIYSGSTANSIVEHSKSFRRHVHATHLRSLLGTVV